MNPGQLGATQFQAPAQTAAAMAGRQDGAQPMRFPASVIAPVPHPLVGWQWARQ